MGKIIRCDESIVVIGMDDKTIKEVRRSDCNFEPVVGDRVEVFESETYSIVSKIEESIKEAEPITKEAGININISNDNSQKSNGLVYPQGAEIRSGKVVRKVTYLILCGLLGGFGIHKFYSGKIGQGIAYLLFCWTYIPAILAFIDFIRACLNNSDINGNIIV